MKDLKGKLALVTGAGSGIGRATAFALAGRGARVIVVDIQERALESVSLELGPACVMSKAVDVADREQMATLAAEVHGRHGALDVLVNNAGVAILGGVLDTPLDDWQWLLNINLNGVIHGCHFFAPAMAARGHGHIVNVSSVLGVVGTPETVAYATSKFAVFGLSESMRLELARKGVGVSTICPGIVATGIIGAARLERGGDALRQRIDRMYKRRAFGPERVGSAIVHAIERNQAVVPVTPEASALIALKRLLPNLTPSLAAMVGRMQSAS